MRKNRLAYLFLIITSAALLFAYGTPFLLMLLLFWIAMAAFLAMAIGRDARRMRLTMEFDTQKSSDAQFVMKLHVRNKGLLPVSRAVRVQLEYQNRMFGTRITREVMLTLEDRSCTYEIPVHTVQCGEIVVRCHGAYVHDLMGLFCRPIVSFGRMSKVIYPEKVNMRVEMSKAIYGRNREEGKIQNRKGNDPSEIFDIREYVPGDDIRSIHWKLSSKTESLILREPSDPSHYNLAVLLDLGLEQSSETLSSETLTAAVSYSMSIISELVRQKVMFCIAIPTKTGLKIYEIHENNDFRNFCSMWLAHPMQKVAGYGLQMFLSEHLEQNFTRLLILSAGKYGHDLKGMVQRIGVTAIGTTKASEVLYMNFGSGIDLVELPEDIKSAEEYNIRC